MESANDMSICKMFAWVEVKRNNQRLPSHYVRKNTEQTKSRHNIENGYEWAQLLNEPGKWCVFLQLCLYFYFLTTVLNFSARSLYD